MSLDDLFYYLAAICAVVFVFAPHEFAHAWVAYKNGDGTAKLNGRLSLNPMRHIDPVGFISCALVGFGWAKPVPVNPANFRNYKKGLFTTAIAGVVVNYLIAFIAYLIYVLILRFVYFNNLVFFIENQWADYVLSFFTNFFFILFTYSLCSVVFNLLPLYPLDGFRVVEAFTRQVNPVQRFLREYGQVILIALIAESFLCDVLIRFDVGWAGYCDVLGYIMKFATEIVGAPIQYAWRWILTV